MGWGYWGGWYKPSKPRKAKGGIRAQSKRGEFGASWWAKRWVSVLESFDIGARLGRGRSYARQGQVLSIQVEKGLVRAKVQGSRPKPYDVTIQARTLPEGDWEALAKALARQAIFSAKLLAGEMPQDIEHVFKEAGLSLFPSKLGDLSTKCSCPDWSNPCKHVAAVYYLLGEEFDRDPFLIFRLRGMEREELLALLGRVGASTAPPLGVESEEFGDEEFAEEPEIAAETESEPLSTEIERFWRGENPALADDALGEVQTPPVPAALPKRLGGFPFWRGEELLLDAVEPIYAQASPRGLEVLLGRESGDEAS